jgi:hypothetical protein
LRGFIKESTFVPLCDDGMLYPLPQSKSAKVFKKLEISLDFQSGFGLSGGDWPMPGDMVLPVLGTQVCQVLELEPREGSTTPTGLNGGVGECLRVWR